MRNKVKIIITLICYIAGVVVGIFCVAPQIFGW